MGPCLSFNAGNSIETKHIAFWNVKHKCINTKDFHSWLINDSVSNIHLINHILVLFKLYIYKSRNKHRLNLNELLGNILNIKKLEKVIAFGNAQKVAAYNNKWSITNRKLPL